jgi:hypothetical protein
MRTLSHLGLGAVKELTEMTMSLYHRPSRVGGKHTGSGMQVLSQLACRGLWDSNVKTLLILH